MKIESSGVEIWMNEYENSCVYNLAETCVESLTVEQLLDITGHRDNFLADILPMKLTYGAIEGTDRLRDNICGLYEQQARNNIIVTHGAIGANALVHSTLVSPGDRVISVLPTYQQHYSIPRAYGADVQILPLLPENEFLPDLVELARLATSNTKLIIINNPSNPTGALMDRSFLEKIAEIARKCGAYILSDEVYRGIDLAGDGFTVSIADVYEKGISTGSMTKVFSLAGLRLGWIAAPVELIQAVAIHRDYTTISVGMLNDYLSCLALESKDKILARSRNITRENLEVLDAWVNAEPSISYIKPKSGTMAFLKYDFDMTSRDFCVRLLRDTGVMLTPGAAMDVEGWLRIGYANNPEVLRNGLAKMTEFLAMLRDERSNS